MNNHKTLPPIKVSTRSRVVLDKPYDYAKVRLQYRVKFLGFKFWKTVNEQYQMFICTPNYFPSVEQMVKAICTEGQKHKSLKLDKRRTVKQALVAASNG